MASLEATLRITAKDDAAAAFKQLKDQISALDKQIATFDKLAVEAGKVGKSVDPMIASIAKSEIALKDQKTAVMAVADSLRTMGSGTDSAAEAQRMLGTATAETTRIMVAQGAEAGRVASQIDRAAKAAKVAQERKAEFGGRVAEGAAVVGSGMGGLAGLMVAANWLTLASRQPRNPRPFRKRRSRSAPRLAGMRSNRRLQRISLKKSRQNIRPSLKRRRSILIMSYARTR
jgi:hypothetical protein